MPLKLQERGKLKCNNSKCGRLFEVADFRSNTERFMKSWHRGGAMLTEWNRLGIQVAGAIFAGFAIYVLYSVFGR